MERRPELIPTGIPGFDTLLGGGIPARHTLVITGEPGTGKTLLCSQIAFAEAARGTPAIFATITSESHDKLIEDLSAFAFFDPDRVGEELFLLSIYPALKKGAKEARDLLTATVRERKARLLVVDGLRAVRDLWRDEAMIREFIYELGVGLDTVGCTALFTAEYPLQTLLSYPESTTVDGIVSLAWSERGPTSRRRVEVVKLRGRQHVTGRNTMRIDMAGVTMVPRLEATPRMDREYRPSDKRATFGIAELDELLGGGLPHETTTLLAGSTGIGKSLLALYFAASGTRQGERSLFYSFAEPPGVLLSRARRVGLELHPFMEKGSLSIEYPPPTEADAEELAQDILDKVASGGYTRLVVDGLVELEESVAEPERIRPFFAALLVKLRAAGVTSIFTKQISKIVGPELDFSDTPIAAMTENLLFLRHVELKGKLHRLLSILNLRDSAFDGSLREFTITAEGLRVLGPVDSVAGLLTGRARPVGTAWREGTEG